MGSSALLVQSDRDNIDPKCLNLWKRWHLLWSARSRHCRTWESCRGFQAVVVRALHAEFELRGMEFRTAVVVEIYRVCCPDFGIKIEKVPQLPNKAPFSKRFEDAVGQARESCRAVGGAAIRSEEEFR
jgi:hypothetical protein